jgi:hypothetical protein
VRQRDPVNLVGIIPVAGGFLGPDEVDQDVLVGQGRAHRFGRDRPPDGHRPRLLVRGEEALPGEPRDRRRETEPQGIPPVHD